MPKNGHGQINFNFFPEEIGYCSHSYHIIQDEYGFLWSATLTGLVKSDGYSYKKFTNNRADSSSIAANFSTYLFEDPFSNIWVNSYDQGFSIYDRSADQFVPIRKAGPQGLRSGRITDMYEAQDGLVYIAGDAGLERVHMHSEHYEDLQFQCFSVPDSLKITNQNSKQIWHISPLNERQLLISCVMGFFVFDTEQERFFNHQDISWLPTGLGFSSWLDPNREHIWLAIAGQTLTRIDRSTGSQEVIATVPIHGGETYFHALNRDQLLLKLNGEGMYLIDLKNLESTYFEAGPQSEINHLDRWSRRFSETEDGTIFIGSNDASRFSHIPSIPSHIEHLQLLDRKNNSASSVYEDEDYFMATFFNNGMYVLDKKRAHKKHYHKANSALVDDLIMQAKRLKDGRFVLTGNTHGYIFDPSDQSLQTLGRSLFFRNAVELQDGSLWLMAGAGGGIQSFTKHKDGRYQEQTLSKDLAAIANVRKVIQEENGMIWLISANTGLYLLNSNQEILRNWQSIPGDTQSLIGNSLESMFLDTQRRLWLGTLEGLSIYYIEEDRFEHFAAADGLDETSISDIIEDADGQIWISSFDGIYQYDEQEKNLQRLALSKTLNQNFAQRGLFRFKNKIYAPGTHGIDIIHRRRRSSNAVIPKIQLVNVIHPDKRLDPARNLEVRTALDFAAQEKQSILEFAPLHFGAPMENQLQYRLTPDAAWEDISRSRQIDLSKISFGKYELELRASNADGIWSPAKSYPLRLQIPWFLSKWFYAALILALLGIIYGLYRWKIRQMVKIQEKQAEIDRQIAEIELKALKAQMNPHFVFNSLNSVKALILEDKRQEAVEYLSSFSDLIRKILNNSNDKFIRLQDELETIRLYLALESLRFDEAFVYEIKVDPAVNADFIEVPALILQAYIENAIWHGLLHKEHGEKKLLIDVRRMDKDIEIIVEDNGIGRQAAALIKTRSSAKTRSFGMTITGQRIDLLKQLYGNQARVQLIDLENNRQESIGTRVIIRFQSMD